jgi:hypothetical protein
MHVQTEWTAVSAVRDTNRRHAGSRQLTAALRTINEALWQIEDDTRQCLHDSDMARISSNWPAPCAGITTNSRLKACVNRLLNSPFSEQKSYPEYRSQ